MDYLKSKAKKGGNIISVWRSDSKESYEVKVFI